MELLVVVVCGYLLGSTSFSIIVTKLVKGVDIRDFGSGNAGMTNVLRTCGKKCAALVLIGDVAKGVIATFIGLSLGSISYAVIGGLAAMLGHSYPLFFGFRGGKGVATGLGIILTLVPDITLIAFGIFVITVFFTRYVSLGSILAALSVPINTLLFHKPLPAIVFGFAASALVVYSHRSNIQRLLQGKENKVGKAK